MRDITRLSSYVWGIYQGCHPTREGLIKVVILRIMDISRMSSYAWGINQGCYPTLNGYIKVVNLRVTEMLNVKGDFKVIIFCVREISRL